MPYKCKLTYHRGRIKIRRSNIPRIKFIFTFCVILTLALSPVFFHSHALATEYQTQKKPVKLHNPISLEDYSSSYKAPEGQFTKLEATHWSSGKRYYYVYAPESAFKNDQIKPALLVLFHEGKRNGASMIDKWKRMATQEGIVLLAPDSDGPSWGVSAEENKYLLELIENVQEKYGTNPKRTYLFGHSSGANMTLAMISLHSDRFAAASLHAGYIEKRLLHSFAKHIRKGTPVTFITGTHDNRFSLAKVRTAALTMEKAGADVKQFEIYDHNHWYYDLAENINFIAWYRLRDFKLP